MHDAPQRTDTPATSAPPAGRHATGSNDAQPQMSLDEVHDLAGRIHAAVSRVIEGKSDAVRTAIIVLLAEGHLLIEDVPGVTRDRVAYDALWNGRRFTLVDTGSAAGLDGRNSGA